MTEATIRGESSAFYPKGREVDRPASLLRNPGETLAALIASLRAESSRLEATWLRVAADSWPLLIEEPSDKPDLGPISLRHLAILRLTEVEVHGTDLDLGLGPWSTTFVEVALPLRVRWLVNRRSNHGSANSSISGRWHFVATDGPHLLLEANPDRVQVHEDANVGPSDVVFEAAGCDLLAFLLGRLSMEEVMTTGDPARASAFHSAFPPP